MIEDVNSPLDAPEQHEVAPEPYLLTDALCEAVNVTITLGRPLLVQGDPGVGKTRLAHAVAYRLGLPLEQAHVKSTSRARDLLYTFDAVRRLSDAQLSGLQHQKLPPPDDYVRLGPLGKAIARAQLGRRTVLLIDEIDKADLDFPNDLLRELDELRFEVDELPDIRYEVPPDRPDLRPIIIVTNNEEKQLPGAFLRRCAFHYIKFPEENLDEILEMHGIAGGGLRSRAREILLELRKLDLNHRPGLSELLDWVECLRSDDVSQAEVANLPKLGALVKHRGDQLRAEKWLRSR
ncbi:MoxR family ATPase [Micromonospora zingiberis]|uniref:MoxR family ATPase n=1 Tax=Micromonospora zingiberis TaxID=2053011 RepID=A0A4R0G1U4_9ACTN|nr:MoxR family ATPase [Micromonospora zingiberis]